MAVLRVRSEFHPKSHVETLKVVACASNLRLVRTLKVVL